MDCIEHVIRPGWLEIAWQTMDEINVLENSTNGTELK